MNRALMEVLDRNGGLVARRQVPDLAPQFDRARRAGKLVTVLPGVGVVPELAADWRTRVRAAGLWDADAVVTGVAAAALTFDPRLVPSIVEVASRRVRFDRPGFRFTKRTIPPELVDERVQVRLTTPAATAIELIPRLGGDVIDDVLRSRQTTLGRMYRALDLTPSRSGNVDRRRVLLDSRGEPWSRGERLAHRHLYAANITRWDSNVEFRCAGQTYFLDIALKDCPLVAEIDGKVHLRPDMFESDRRRGDYLLLAGKQVMHFTYLMVLDEPDWFVSMIRRGIAYCS